MCITTSWWCPNTLKVYVMHILCIYMPKTCRLQIQTMHNTDPEVCPGTTTHISWSDKWQSRKRKKQTILLYGFAIRTHLLILMLLPLTQFNVLKSISITLCQAPLQMVTWVCWGKSASGPNTRPTSQDKKIGPSS